jgi:hypothetical protein
LTSFQGQLSEAEARQHEHDGQVHLRQPTAGAASRPQASHTASLRPFHSRGRAVFHGLLPGANEASIFPRVASPFEVLRIFTHGLPLRVVSGRALVLHVLCAGRIRAGLASRCMAANAITSSQFLSLHQLGDLE